MLRKGIIKKEQTLYSFRHTAAVQLYTQTNSLNTLKTLMGHSSLQVTLKYLRSLKSSNPAVVHQYSCRCHASAIRTAKIF